jgi:hypothetical protein
MTATDPIDSERPEPPTLDAYRSLDGWRLYVWCKYCLEWHDHTAHAYSPDCHVTRTGSSPCTCPPGSGDGPRVAHCLDRTSPYVAHAGFGGLGDTGYVLREVGPFTPEVQRAKGIGG